MSATSVTFRNVSKNYPGQAALRDVSFSLPKHQVIGLVGPNGSGKSTSLKLMSGLVRPTRGVVEVNGRVVTRRQVQEVAYLSELDVLYPFTVEQLVRFYSQQYDDFDLRKAVEMLAFMELDGAKNVKHLSKGNRGRLKLVLTLSRRAPLLLLDEPLSGLDPLARESIIQALISFVDLEQQTVILTTHEVAEIEPLLETVVILYDGRVLQVAEVESIRRQHGKSLVQWMKELLR